MEAARLAAEAAKLEEEQAIREAETQARINEANLEAANESKRRVLEAERIKTQTLITKIENEKAVADILFEITRIRLRGTEERAALTNEWLEERARETEAVFLVGVELNYGFGGSWGLFPQSIPR